MMEVSIWDDSLCTVEEEYNSPVIHRTPKKSVEFRNSLINNKGDITTARKISNDVTKFCWSEEDISKYSCINISSVSLGNSSDSISNDGCIDISNPAEVAQLARKVLENKKLKKQNDWKLVGTKQILLDSDEIMKRIS